MMTRRNLLPDVNGFTRFDNASPALRLGDEFLFDGERWAVQGTTFCSREGFWVRCKRAKPLPDWAKGAERPLVSVESK